MKILYFGPIAPKGSGAIGGYEAANRKNITQLEIKGIEVIEYPNPIIPKTCKLLGKIIYIKLLVLPFKLLKYKNNKDTILHITPLYRNLIVPAVFTEWFAKKLNIPILLDIRAGSFVDIYKNHGMIKRKLMNILVKYATRITVEGKSYINDIKNITNYKRQIDYFPNIVDCNDNFYTSRDMGTINLFYFGRITKIKGIGCILKTMQLLDNNYHLYLAGNIAPDVDETTLKSEKITYLGMLTPIQLKNYMKKMHIFFFPTRHPGEGQSNSLIEAMSEGLIPVTTDQGFCKEVVADCGKVLPRNSDAVAYKNAITEIISGDMVEQGKRCIEHIKKYHNVETEISKLINIYKEMLCR